MISAGEKKRKSIEKCISAGGSPMLVDVINGITKDELRSACSGSQTLGAYCVSKGLLSFPEVYRRAGWLQDAAMEAIRRGKTRDVLVPGIFSMQVSGSVAFDVLGDIVSWCPWIDSGERYSYAEILCISAVGMNAKWFPEAFFRFAGTIDWESSLAVDLGKGTPSDENYASHYAKLLSLLWLGDPDKPNGPGFSLGIIESMLDEPEFADACECWMSRASEMSGFSAKNFFADILAGEIEMIVGEKMVPDIWNVEIGGKSPLPDGVASSLYFRNLGMYLVSSRLNVPQEFWACRESGALAKNWTPLHETLASQSPMGGEERKKFVFHRISEYALSPSSNEIDSPFGLTGTKRLGVDALRPESDMSVEFDLVPASALADFLLLAKPMNMSGFPEFIDVSPNDAFHSVEKYGKAFWEVMCDFGYAPGNRDAYSGSTVFGKSNLFRLMGSRLYSAITKFLNIVGGCIASGAPMKKAHMYFMQSVLPLGEAFLGAVSKAPDEWLKEFPDFSPADFPHEIASVSNSGEEIVPQMAVSMIEAQRKRFLESLFKALSKLIINPEQCVGDVREVVRFAYSEAMKIIGNRSDLSDLAYDFGGAECAFIDEYSNDLIDDGMEL